MSYTNIVTGLKIIVISDIKLHLIDGRFGRTKSEGTVIFTNKNTNRSHYIYSPTPDYRATTVTLYLHIFLYSPSAEMPSMYWGNYFIALASEAFEKGGD